MLSNIIVQKILYSEVKKLIILYRREIRKYLSYSFLDYLKNLLFPKGRSKYYKFIRIIFLFFLVRFIIDIIRFFFNFYYITLNWFLYNLKFSIKYYTDNELAISIFNRIIDFLKYFILFIPFVNLSGQLNKRKLTLPSYIIVKISHRIMKAMYWRPRFRRKLVYPVRAIKFLIAFFFLQPIYALRDFLLLWVIFLERFNLYFMDWILFIRTIYHVWQYNRIAGVSYLRKGASLFHIAVLMQKRGFQAPSSSGYDKFKAIVDYRDYRKKYKQSDLPPDYLNNAALDIYVFLLELFSDTRYELKKLPIVEFFFIIFPYEFLAKLFIFSYYLYIGIVFFLYCVLIPLTFVYLGVGIMFDYAEVLKVIHFLLFRDLDYLAKEKDKIWTSIRNNPLRRIEIDWKRDKKK